MTSRATKPGTGNGQLPKWVKLENKNASSQSLVQQQVEMWIGTRETNLRRGPRNPHMRESRRAGARLSGWENRKEGMGEGLRRDSVDFKSTNWQLIV